MGTTQTFLVYQNIVFEFDVPFATLVLPIVGNTGCDPLFFTTPVGATHSFVQHLQFYRNPTDSMEAGAGN